MPSSETLGYSSMNVHRASRINEIEGARLEKKISCFEQARLHQVRLTNQAIRLLTVSLDYIQASSGHSPEARTSHSPGTGDTLPFVLYGERIWNRKRRRITRPTSAVVTRWGDPTLGSLALTSSDTNLSQGQSVSSIGQSWSASSIGQSRPVSSIGQGWSASSIGQGRPASSIGQGRSSSSLGRSRPSSAKTSSHETTCDQTARRTECMSPFLTPRERATPHQDWEDDTAEVTKKIFKNQERERSGKGHGVYQSAGEVLIQQSSRSVRGLMRQIKISATPISQQLQAPEARPGHGDPRLITQRLSTTLDPTRQKKVPPNAKIWHS
ncbi:uncharacterized protein LOC131939642 [Physella acuta]|uniref:uncharacterized protein LOC131939642 n=1 Tax=Physella acuta TaxID=109671 RepID=UPI0027DCC15B|nr:uncharacterized protein LOC131939642 [Physella acuta]XP_059154066.1 uncharacterized protein LOC131939642 [Physella acuta]